MTIHVTIAARPPVNGRTNHTVASQHVYGAAPALLLPVARAAVAGCCGGEPVAVGNRYTCTCGRVNVSMEGVA